MNTVIFSDYDSGCCSSALLLNDGVTKFLNGEIGNE